jgi:hypothetical protein
MRDDKKECKIKSTSHEHWENSKKCGKGWNKKIRKNHPTKEEEGGINEFNDSIDREHGRHVCFMFPSDQMFHRSENNTEPKTTDEKEDIKMLEGMDMKEWLERVQSQEGIPSNVRIMVDIIGVDMMLDDVLMDPIYSGTTNPILRQSKETIDGWGARNCTVIGIMLDVESNEGKEQTKGGSKIPNILAGDMNVNLKRREGMRKGLRRRSTGTSRPTARIRRENALRK